MFTQCTGRSVERKDHGESNAESRAKIEEIDIEDNSKFPIFPTVHQSLAISRNRPDNLGRKFPHGIIR